MRCIYLAGPITKPDPMQNALEAILVADQLVKLGYCPFIPQLSVFWSMHGTLKETEDYGEIYEMFMKIDFEWISRCDGLLRLPGYSAGADREVALAASLNIPVFYSIEELESHMVALPS